MQKKKHECLLRGGELWITLHLFVRLFQTTVIRSGRCLSPRVTDVFKITLIGLTGFGVVWGLVGVGGGWKNKIKALTRNLLGARLKRFGAMLVLQISLQERQHAPY